MRQDQAEFVKRGVQVVILGPDGPNAFKRFWEEQQMPFIGCADIKSKVADTFFQEVNLLKLGRMPAMFVIDQQGVIRFSHYGSAMSDIPENMVVLAAIDALGLPEKNQ